MSFLGFARILLNPGQTYEYKVTGEEQVLVLQAGDFTAWVRYRGEIVLNAVKGDRKSVFDTLPTALYLPPSSEVKLHSERGMEARIFTAYCEEGNPPYYCPPEAVEEGEPGAHIYKRKYRFIFGSPGKHNDNITGKLIVGESVSVPGGWIGFPGHRHDHMTENEYALDEIFSFRVTSKNGRGGLLQCNCDLTNDNRKIWDEVNVIEEDNTAIALPTGYHTTVAMPGSVVYLLWGLAGAQKTYKVRFDERYAWLEDCLY
jgi:5-deoxy-glucuronate isomerase